MSQIKLQQLDNNWVNASTIFTPVSDKTYYLQNRGNDYMVACEGSQVPTDMSGVYIAPHKMARYKLGSQNLYLRAHNGTCSVNISDED